MGYVCKTFETIYGIYKIEVEDAQVIAIRKQNIENIMDAQEPNFKEGNDEDVAMMNEAYIQLCQYLARERKEFELPMNPHGTVFQKKVWNALCEIPYGETRSYQDIAIAVGSPKACRAVGMANHINPIIIAVPCHRVIGANGKIVGYGQGIDMQIHLLDIEGVSIEN